MFDSSGVIYRQMEQEEVIIKLWNKPS
jgi:hypothetical protein